MDHHERLGTPRSSRSKTPGRESHPIGESSGGPGHSHPRILLSPRKQNTSLNSPHRREKTPIREDIDDSSGFLSAAFKGDIDRIRYYFSLEDPTHLNVVDSLGNTALHLSAFSGHEDVVQLLLDTQSVLNSPKGDTPMFADATAKNVENDTPLFLAVLSNKLGIVRLVAEAVGREVNIANVEGFTPLHYSAGEGNLDITVFLVEECAADVKALDNMRLTPCFCAVLQGRVEVVKYLLGKDPSAVLLTNSIGDSMLHCALKAIETSQASFDIVKILVDFGAPMDMAGGGPQRLTGRQLLQEGLDMAIARQSRQLLQIRRAAAAEVRMPSPSDSGAPRVQEIQEQTTADTNLVDSDGTRAAPAPATRAARTFQEYLRVAASESTSASNRRRYADLVAAAAAADSPPADSHYTV